MTCAICRLNPALRICATCERLLHAHGIYPRTKDPAADLPFAAAEKAALEAEMLDLARQSFLTIWQRYGCPGGVDTFEKLVPERSTNMATAHRRVMIIGLTLGWHKEVA